MSIPEGWDGTTSQGPPPYVPDDVAGSSVADNSPGVRDRASTAPKPSARSGNPYVLRRVMVGLLALAVVVAVWAAVTSGSDEGGDDRNTTAKSAAPGTASMTAAEVMSVDPQFATFAKLLKKSGLPSKMNNEKGYTFLVPSSTALASMDQAELAKITKDPKGKLAKMVGRHIIAGKMKAADLSRLNGKTVTTISGAKLPVAVTPAGVTVGGVVLAKFDIDAKQAEIHVLDTVIPAPK